jgi:hypothetical protein
MQTFDLSKQKILISIKLRLEIIQIMLHTLTNKQTNKNTEQFFNEILNIF